jgi:hypothetical protein
MNRTKVNEIMNAAKEAMHGVRVPVPGGLELLSDVGSKEMLLMVGNHRGSDARDKEIKYLALLDTYTVVDLCEHVIDTQDENTRLRAVLANGSGDCIYCKLPASDMSRCPDGFPGCARADDAVNCKHFGAALGLEDLEAKLRAAEHKLMLSVIGAIIAVPVLVFAWIALIRASH